jgi:membrane-bound metal-dependent hydrolase YbcI (DUF457 family)
MPSPIGHALGGAIVSVVMGRSAGRPPPPPGRSTLRETLLAPGVVVAVVAACAPDLDFLWGRHNMETHSAGAAVFAGMATWIVARDPRLGLTVGLAWLSHVLFDWLGSDDTPPLGVMALWPFSREFFFADAFVFEAISRRYWLDNFISHNAWAVAKEVLILGPAAGALWLWRMMRR